MTPEQKKQYRFIVTSVSFCRRLMQIDCTLSHEVYFETKGANVEISGCDLPFNVNEHEGDDWKFCYKAESIEHLRKCLLFITEMPIAVTLKYSYIQIDGITF